MNLLFLLERYHISILDGGADTWVLGKGWEILSVQSSRRANVVAFDHETAIQRNFSILSAIIALDLTNGQSVLLVIHESIYNETSNQSLLSEFQFREFGIIIDSICHRHDGAQQMIMKDSDDRDALTIPVDLAGCMLHFRHRLPTTEEISTLKQYCLTQGDKPWNLSSFSDQVAGKFYQQVIDTENYIASSKNLLDDTTDKVNQGNLKLSFHDPSDLLANNLKAKQAHLAFYTDTVQNANINYTVPTNADPHYSNVLPSKIDYEKLAPYFAFRPHDIIQNTLQQTTQLAKSTI